MVAIYEGMQGKLMWKFQVDFKTKRHHSLYQNVVWTL